MITKTCRSGAICGLKPAVLMLPHVDREVFGTLKNCFAIFGAPKMHAFLSVNNCALKCGVLDPAQFLITIVGAGPAGAFAGHLLARKGCKVEIYEEHKDVGSPVQCTGLVTGSINKILEIDKRCIINKIDKVRIYSPDRRFISLKFREKNIILDRKRFDRFLADKAVKSGAKILLRHKVLGYDGKTLTIKDIGKNRLIRIKNSLVIGADGPNSIISKSFNSRKRRCWIGLQYRVKYNNDNAIEFYPFIGTFLWIVPEDKTTARIGIVGNNDVNHILDRFLQKRIGKDFRKKIIERQAGLIPRFDPLLKLQHKRAFLVGDAASLVKATTAGGIIQSLESSKILADSILYRKNYSRQLKKKVCKDLLAHLYMRKMMDKFNEKDWRRLVRCFSSPKMRKILEEIDRDHSVKMASKLLIKNPRLIYFLRYII